MGVLQCAHNAALSNTRRQLLQHIVGLLTLLLPVLQVHGLLPQPSDFMIWVAVDGTVAAFGYYSYLQTWGHHASVLGLLCGAVVAFTPTDGNRALLVAMTRNDQEVATPKHCATTSVAAQLDTSTH